MNMAITRKTGIGARISQFLVGAVCSFWMSSVMGGQSVTDSGMINEVFSLTFPEGWTLTERGTPLVLLGPRGEALFISVARPDPAKPLPDIADAELLKFWRPRIEKALTAVTASETMSVTRPFQESQLNGMPFFGVASHDSERGAFFAGYGLVGKAGVVFLVTVEGDAAREEDATRAVEQMLTNIEWHVH